MNHYHSYNHQTSPLHFHHDSCLYPGSRKLPSCNQRSHWKSFGWGFLARHIWLLAGPIPLWSHYLPSHIRWTYPIPVISPYPPLLAGAVPSGWWFIATPLKNMTSSIGMMTFPVYGKIKLMATKPPTSPFIFVGLQDSCALDPGGHQPIGFPSGGSWS